MLLPPFTLAFIIPTSPDSAAQRTEQSSNAGVVGDGQAGNRVAVAVEGGGICRTDGRLAGVGVGGGDGTATVRVEVQVVEQFVAGVAGGRVAHPTTTGGNVTAGKGAGIGDGVGIRFC